MSYRRAPRQLVDLRALILCNQNSANVHASNIWFLISRGLLHLRYGFRGDLG